MSTDNVDVTKFLQANYTALQAAIEAQGREVGELRLSIHRLPENMAPLIENAVFRGLRDHVNSCPMVQNYPDISRELGVHETKLEDISKVVDVKGEITNTMRRKLARSGRTGISISPDGIRATVPWKSPVIYWIIAGVVAASGAIGVREAIAYLGN